MTIPGLGNGADAIQGILETLQAQIATNFNTSKNNMQKQFGDYIDMIKEFKEDDLKERAADTGGFLQKFVLWLTECGVLFGKIVAILYIPICWFLITRKGYSVGGTDLNNFPYRDPAKNQKSFNQIADLYKQAGGGGGKFNITGPYNHVSIPYEGILDAEATGFTQNVRAWAIDSFAGSISVLRFILSFILAASRDMTGYNSGSDWNFAKFILSIPLGYFLTIIITILGLFVGMLLNLMTLTVKVKDYWWPFAGTRLFSGATWILILMVFGIFAPYSSFIFLLVTMISALYSFLQHMGLIIFIFGAPFTFAYKKVKMGETGELLDFMKAVFNGLFWVYMFAVLFIPTYIIWGAQSMTGGLAYLLYVLYTRGPNVF